MNQNNYMTYMVTYVTCQRKKLDGRAGARTNRCFCSVVALRPHANGFARVAALDPAEDAVFNGISFVVVRLPFWFESGLKDAAVFVCKALEKK